LAKPIIPPGQQYFTCGTVYFVVNDKSGVMNPRGDIFWVEKRLIGSFREGQQVWLIYKKAGQDRTTEVVLPYADATLEELSKDFDEEEPARTS